MLFPSEILRKHPNQTRTAILTSSQMGFCNIVSSHRIYALSMCTISFDSHSIVLYFGALVLFSVYNAINLMSNENYAVTRINSSSFNPFIYVSSFSFLSLSVCKFCALCVGSCYVWMTRLVW